MSELPECVMELRRWALAADDDDPSPEEYLRLLQSLSMQFDNVPVEDYAAFLDLVISPQMENMPDEAGMFCRALARIADSPTASDRVVIVARATRYCLCDDESALDGLYDNESEIDVETPGIFDVVQFLAFKEAEGSKHASARLDALFTDARVADETKMTITHLRARIGRAAVDGS